MPIPQNPANTRLATDVKIFRRKINKPSPKDPDSAKHIREHLHEKNKYKYKDKPQSGKNDDILTVKAFRDLTSWQSARDKDDQDWTEVPNRLGGGLDDDTPKQFQPRSNQNPKGLPDPVYDPNNHYIKWIPEPVDDPNTEVTVEILPGDIVKHTDDKQIEMPDAHRYMHGIFSQILYTIRDLLEEINGALEEYANVVSEDDPASTLADAYTAAVKDFETYCASLQPGGDSKFSKTLNFVSINPVVTNEGFIVSCRLKMNWKNPYHSSSTIQIP